MGESWAEPHWFRWPGLCTVVICRQTATAYDSDRWKPSWLQIVAKCKSGVRKVGATGITWWDLAEAGSHQQRLWLLRFDGRLRDGVHRQSSTWATNGWTKWHVEAEGRQRLARPFSYQRANVSTVNHHPLCVRRNGAADPQDSRDSEPHLSACHAWPVLRFRTFLPARDRFAAGRQPKS